ncbi:hypothetical protein KI387_013231, partial [Taxus chinensis]
QRRQGTQGRGDAGPWETGCAGAGEGTREGDRGVWAVCAPGGVSWGSLSARGNGCGSLSAGPTATRGAHSAWDLWGQGVAGGFRGPGGTVGAG